MLELGGIVGLESGGLHYGADLESLPVLQGDVVHPRRAGRLLDLRAGVDFDLRIALDLLDPGVEAGVLQIAIGRGLGIELMQLVQHATQDGFSLHQADVIAGPGGLDRRGHSGHATADHEDGLVDLGFKWLGYRRLPRPGTAHAEVVLGQHLRIFVVRRVAPDD
jgi:hypothetical protein